VLGESSMVIRLRNNYRCEMFRSLAAVPKPPVKCSIDTELDLSATSFCPIIMGNFAIDVGA
jgi:hypothetical protein